MNGTEPSGFRPARDVILPMAYLAAIMWLDHLTPRTTITPLFGIIGLFAMAFFLRPLWMIFWSVVYSGVVFCVFLLPAWGFFISWVSPSSDPLTPYVRTGAFFAVAIMASRLCIALAKLSRTNSDLRGIFDRLSFPLIASDHNGRIRYLNEAAGGLLQGKPRLCEGDSIFELAPKERRGKTIADYLRRFKSTDVFPSKPLELELQGRRHLGVTCLMESTSPKLLITMISSPSERETGVDPVPKG